MHGAFDLSGCQADKLSTDPYLSLVRQIIVDSSCAKVGKKKHFEVLPLFCVLETTYEDRNKCGDFAIIEEGDSSKEFILVRLRGFRSDSYLERYRWDFTIRSWRKSGKETELKKIISGLGKELFYGHVDYKIHDIKAWMRISLDSFRWHRNERVRSKKEQGKPSTMTKSGFTYNPDGVTGFAWYDVRYFLPHPPILIASSHEYEQML